MQMKERFTRFHLLRVLIPLCYGFVSSDSFHITVAIYEYVATHPAQGEPCRWLVPNKYHGDRNTVLDATSKILT
jgi:hypothetical protein